MSNITIPNLPTAGSLQSTDLLIVEQSDGTKKTTVAALPIILDPAPYDAGTATTTKTFARSNGLFQKATMTDANPNNLVINVSGGTVGELLKLWITTPSAHTNTITFDGILLPSDSGLTLPKSVTNSKTYIILLQYNGTAWMLLSLVGGYG